MPTWMLILMRETRTLAGIKGLWDGVLGPQQTTLARTESPHR
jgi:hypothetical protein